MENSKQESISLLEFDCRTNLLDKNYSSEKVIEIVDILFREIIDEVTLSRGITDYTAVNMTGRVDEFLINYDNFNTLIKTNSHYKFCKFYFLQNNQRLNLGLAFSDHEEIQPEANDGLYTLQGFDFVKDINFSKKRNDFVSKGGLRDIMKSYYSTTITEVVLYELEMVFIYNLAVSHSYKVEKLEFKMFKYPSIYEKDPKKENRISFAVNPVLTGLNSTQTKSFDAGDLKP